MLEERVWETVCKYKLIEEGDNIILGLSGGPDSMALLYILMSIRKKIEFNIVLAHVNHGVRGEDALKDEMFVKRVSESLNLQYYSKRGDMIGLAKEKNISQEEAGRELRYGFFRDVIKKLGKGKIAVAHNRKDQAETLIMRIIRGTGIDGLKGMDFKTEDIIRPILDINRWEIEKYIEDSSIETVLDKTNLETIYTRNKIRIELIPYIEDNFNPNIVDSLFRLSENARVDSEFLEKYTSDRYEKLSKRSKNDTIYFKYDLFKDEVESIKKRMIRKAIGDLKGNLQGIEEVHIASVIDLFTRRETGKMINLPDGILANVSYNDLIIKKISDKTKTVGVQKICKAKLELGENIFGENEFRINVEIFDKKDIDYKEISRNRKYFDYNKIVGDLFIRGRESGDSFIPYGMKGSKKLKDYFIDEKIPRDIRENIPLIVDEKNIVWVIGYRTSESYKVESNTKIVLRLEYNDN